MRTPTPRYGRLGDTVARDYASKLRLFNALAEPELQEAIARLRLGPGMRVLDVGCGTGETLRWLAAAVAPDGLAVGLDLSANHLRTAHGALSGDLALLQADLHRVPLAAATFDLVWSVNTVNHVTDQLAAAREMVSLLRPGGRLVLGQSSFLPDMYFAWDARLERVTTDAVRAYYRDRYQLTEQDLTAVRSLGGLLREAGLFDVGVRTIVIERFAPLDPRAQEWLLEAIFRGTWGDRLRPYLAATDYQELNELCDPQHPRFALVRPDFHFLQTFTLAIGSA